MDPLVYIIVLNWNGIEHLPVCFRSLRELSYGNKKIIMVDNDSTDGSQDFVRAEFPEVEIIQNSSNIGFSAANNVGMRYALEKGPAYIALLNNDMEVDANWISHLVEAAEGDAQIGACATKMLYFYDRGIINGIGICMNRIGLAWDHLNGRYDIDGIRVDPEVIGACGGAFFVRSEALRRAGLFDPVYFTYYEDAELSLRVWEEGYRIVTVPEARVYHKFAATMVENSRWKNYLVWRNRYRMIMKCWPVSRLAGEIPGLLRWEWRCALSHLLQGDRRGLLVQAAALVTPLRHFPSIVRSRMERGPITRERVWQMMKPGLRPRPIRLPQPPAPGWLHPSSDSAEPGADGAQLGRGWYRMWEPADTRYRWFAREASLSLRPKRAGETGLSLVICNDYRQLEKIELSVYAGDQRIGVLVPEEGWRKYRLPLTVRGTAPLILTLRAGGLYSADETGERTDLSFKVKEVSIEQAAP